jgi:leucyl aminopeptidase (aminopeptidase T)
MARPAFLVVVLATLLCAGRLSAQAGGLDRAAIAHAVVARMALKPGEKVLFMGRPGVFDTLTALIRKETQRVGGQDLGVYATGPGEPSDWETAFTRGSRGASRAELAKYLAGADLAVMLPGTSSEDSGYAAMQDVLRTGHGRTIHFHWAGAYDLEGQFLPLSDHISHVYERAIVETDYRRLAEIQLRFERALRGRTVRVTTPADTDLHFEIGNRPVTRQDGDASAARAREARVLIDREIEIPCGAVRVAPLEETVEGTIAFPPGQWNGRDVEELVVRFAKGRIVDVRARSGQDAVEAELKEGGDGARFFREFVLGFNPELAVPESAPWIPYYGYGAGVVRLSLGDNSELGGKVTGGYVRWNLFTDATVTAGGQVWVRDGKLQ